MCVFRGPIAYCQPLQGKKLDISSILAGHGIFVLILYTEKWDNSTFWNVFAGH